MLKGVYKNDDGSVSIITPTQEVIAMFSSEREALQKVCEKDVPFGKKFIIVDESILPDSREFRNAWTIDDAELTDGVGGELNTFEELVW